MDQGRPEAAERRQRLRQQTGDKLAVWAWLWFEFRGSAGVAMVTARRPIYLNEFIPLFLWAMTAVYGSVVVVPLLLILAVLARRADRIRPRRFQFGFVAPSVLVAGAWIVTVLQVRVA